MWEAPELHRRLPRGGVKGGTVAPFHPFARSRHFHRILLGAANRPVPFQQYSVTASLETSRTSSVLPPCYVRKEPLERITKCTEESSLNALRKRSVLPGPTTYSVSSSHPPVSSVLSARTNNVVPRFPVFFSSSNTGRQFSRGGRLPALYVPEAQLRGLFARQEQARLTHEVHTAGY